LEGGAVRTMWRPLACTHGHLTLCGHRDYKILYTHGLWLGASGSEAADANPPPERGEKRHVPAPSGLWRRVILKSNHPHSIENPHVRVTPPPPPSLTPGAMAATDRPTSNSKFEKNAGSARTRSPAAAARLGSPLSTSPSPRFGPLRRHARGKEAKLEPAVGPSTCFFLTCRSLDSVRIRGN
jgi:hypothetical protein